MESFKNVIATLIKLTHVQNGNFLDNINMAGRKRIPDEIKILKGTAQKCRMSKTGDVDLSLQIKADQIKPPAWLDAQAKRIYKSKAVQLVAVGVLSTLDLELLSTYSEAMSIVIKASNEIHTNGLLISRHTKLGNVVEANPAVKIVANYIKVINQIGAQFGFSPSSRASILAMAAPKETKKDDFAEFEEV